MKFVIYMLVGLVAGWLAGKFVKGGGSGIIGYIIVGVFGAVLGGVLFDVLGMSAAGRGWLGDLTVATVGAIVFLFLLRVVRKT